MLSALSARHNITTPGRPGSRRAPPRRPAPDELIEIPSRVHHANRKIIQSVAVDRRETGPSGQQLRWAGVRGDAVRLEGKVSGVRCRFRLMGRGGD